MSRSVKNIGLLEFEGSDNPLNVHIIRQRDTGASLCENGVYAFLLRTYRAVSEPVLLTNLIEYQPNENGYRLLLNDDSGHFECRLECNFTESGTRFRAKYIAPEPIWLVEWSLSGLDLDEIIIPALGGQKITKQMPEQSTLSYKYPFWLNAQFVAGVKDKGGLWIYSHETSTNLKLVRIRRENNGFTLSYGFEAPAKKRLTAFETEWCLEGFTGGWQEPAAEYRDWMENSFRIKPLYQKRTYPDWAQNINFVLELWGARRDTRKPHHTFEQMTERLEAFQKLHDPQQTLLYLPGFAEHGIDSHIPDYHPSALLGGREKFKIMIDTAHEFGYKVMIHTNVLGMTFAHPKYPEFKKHQVVDAFGRLQGWGMDMDGDWLTEPYFAYINPGTKAWSKLMIETIGGLIQEFQIDAVFLDQTLLAFNVRRGPDFISGMRRHIQRLQKAFPQTLFAGEGLHEQVLSCLPMAQIHGIDSLNDVHGMEGREPWRQAHSVSSFLFGKYTRLTAHLLTKHPTHPMFRSQEESYTDLNVIPALCLYDYDQALDLPETQRMIQRAKQLKEVTEHGKY